MLEVELEDLIYEQPWLLSPELLPLEHILGDGGLPGRQVRLKGGQYRPDLLFKTRTGRPVVVELKRGRITRSDIGQVLEYGGAFRLLEKGVKEQFCRDFAESKLPNPRLFLVGAGATEVARAAASLAGIELVTFDTSLPKEVSMSDALDRLREFKALAEGGEFPGLVGRQELVQRVRQAVGEACEGIEGVSLDQVDPGDERWWDDGGFPFCEFTIEFADDYWAGVFEFSPTDAEYRFNHETWWLCLEAPEWEGVDGSEVVRQLAERVGRTKCFS